MTFKIRASLPLAALALAALSPAQTTFSRALIASHGNDNKTANGPTSASNAYVDAGGAYASRASADYGVLRAYATATSTVGGGGYHYATANASFGDTITIQATDPAVQGASGFLTYTFTVDGKQTASGGGGVNDPISADAYISLNSANGLAFDHYYGDGSSSSGGVVGTHTEKVAFTFGQPFKIGLSIVAGAALHDEVGLTATSDFEHTALWGGFGSVTDGSGNMAAYSLSSASGHDWRFASVEPVPEPSALAALGLGAVALLRRRKRA